MSHATLRARLGVTAASLIAGLGLSLIPAASTATAAAPLPISNARHAQLGSAAATPRHRRSRASRHAAHHARLMRHHDKLVHKVIAEARRQKGKPYSYGAAGPGAFDCSGLVMYVFQHSVGVSLPHNAAEQYHALKHIKRSRLMRGDLIFTDNGYISHVGIFAGHHHWWVAPQTGTRVHKQRIYDAHFVYARVLRIHH